MKKIGSAVVSVGVLPQKIVILMMILSCIRSLTTTTTTAFTITTATTRSTTTQLLRRLPRTILASSVPNKSRLFSSSTIITDFDVIVVGGGHAGCEAAAAAARTGAKTALVTQKFHTVGELSCNPSIGGIGKGHLVREIDALDGLQGITADMAGIHYRVLNRRKGPAVRGPRAQMDRDLYQQHMQSTLKTYPNLHLVEASVQDVLLDESSSSATTTSLESLAPFAKSLTTTTTTKSSSTTTASAEAAVNVKRHARIRGVVIEPNIESGSSNHDNPYKGITELSARAVIITTGTFLRGVLLLGRERYAGGRHLRDSEKVEAPSIGLAQTLERFQFPLGRLKTGTPARIDGNTIDWDACVIQPTENPAQPFSHLLQFQHQQPPCIAANTVIDCYQTATNDKTHELVMKYQDTLPVYDGMEGAGNGPRYCPSIYKKVVRFPERTSHNSFLEPEGLNTNLVYPNGMSGPYPPEIQKKILRTMKGLGAVEIIRPGYDVEYDFINPHHTITHTMETHKIGGLYLAGQICGTTGYEEAAAQGIIAGANAGKAAVAAANGDAPPAPFIIGRDEGYIGVLIDDLVTRGTTEPYRMFTSRAEYRISLRADNADLRLTQKAADFGLIQNEQRMEALETRQTFLMQGLDRLSSFQLPITEWSKRGDPKTMGGDQMGRKEGQKKSAEEVLMMPHVTLKEVEDVMMQVAAEEGEEEEVVDSRNPGDAAVDVEPSTPLERTPTVIFDTLEASVKYQSYVRRQHKDMESWRKAQGLRIPPDVVYSREYLPTLSAEELEKLNRLRPSTFAEASKISGLTPNSLVYLYHHVNGRNRKRDQARGDAKTRAQIDEEPQQVANSS